MTQAHRSSQVHSALPAHEQVRSLARQLNSSLAPETIEALSSALGRSDSVAQEAMQALVSIGQPAVVHLVASLHSRSTTRRWHAAKALAAIASPDGIEALIATLNDEDASVRWEAAFGLAAIGEPALAPLLHALSTERITCWFALGALRVLHRLAPYAPHLRMERLMWMLGHAQGYVSAPVEAYGLLLQLPSQHHSSVDSRETKG